MGKLNLYKIRDLALASGRSVYTIQQLAHLIARPKSIAKVYASRLVNKGLATRVLRGKITFIDDDFVVLSQLIEPSYVSLSSALLFHGITTQVPAYAEGVTTRNSRRYEGLGVVYHRIHPSLFYGYEKYKKSGGYAFVADPEKAIIDGTYLGTLPRSTVAELADSLDREKLRAYVERFKGRGRKKMERWLL